MEKKGTLKTEYTTLPKYNIDTGEMEKGKGDRIVAFQWYRMSEDQYLVILPRIFAKASGDSFAIVSAKKFLRLLNTKD